jgi:hypothetical protein
MASKNGTGKRYGFRYSRADLKDYGPHRGTHLRHQHDSGSETRHSCFFRRVILSANPLDIDRGLRGLHA